MPKSIKEVRAENREEVAKENWHAIEGSNGMCGCGMDKGYCGNRLEQLLSQAESKLLQAVVEKIEEMRKPRESDPTNAMRGYDQSYNAALADLKSYLEAGIKENK